MSRGSMRTDEMLEIENERLLESVAAKAKLMKSVGLDMNREVKSQNMQLGDMSGDFEGAGGLLGSTLKGLNNMTRSGNSRFMLYIIAGILFFFFVIYYLTSMRR
ncbi:BET1 homolog [Sycon ciliatum]|uniref:BET1 homolog n=1 Tax=Sycon ciliatum TaxID=27933 RepID=UPI0020AE909B|eukprot:scpid97976/ scgid12038/ BET1-like protein